MWEYMAPVLVLLLSLITGGNAASCSLTSFGQTTYIYCFGSCCGSYGSQYCCPDTYTYTYSYYYVSYSLGAGAIAGAVIGSITFIGVIIGITVCVCIGLRSRRYAGGGQVIRSGQATVVTTTAGSQQMYPAGQIAAPQPAPYYYNNAGFATGPAVGAPAQSQYPNMAPAPTTAQAPHPAQFSYPVQGPASASDPPPYPGMNTPEKSTQPAYM